MRKNTKMLLAVALLGGAYLYMQQKKVAASSANNTLSGQGWGAIYNSLDEWGGNASTYTTAAGDKALYDDDFQNMSDQEKWDFIQMGAPGVTRDDWNAYQAGNAVGTEPSGYTQQDYMLINQFIA